MTDKQLRENIIKFFDTYVRTDDSDEPYWNIPCGDSFYGTIYEVMSLFTHQLELAKIAERLDICGRINYIHDKYPGDSTEDDRLFRNEFMKMFSEYMGETTKMVESLPELTKQKEDLQL